MMLRDELNDVMNALGVIVCRSEHAEPGEKFTCDFVFDKDEGIPDPYKWRAGDMSDLDQADLVMTLKTSIIDDVSALFKRYGIEVAFNLLSIEEDGKRTLSLDAFVLTQEENITKLKRIARLRKQTGFSVVR